jgi:hypothetical protein
MNPPRRVQISIVIVFHIPSVAREPYGLTKSSLSRKNRLAGRTCVPEPLVQAPGDFHHVKNSRAVGTEETSIETKPKAKS